MISTTRWKNGNPRRWGCAREGKKRSSSCLLNERLPFLLANHYIISQPLSSKPQPAPHKHETEVANPQYLLHWQHLIPQNQIAAVYVLRSGRMKPQRVLPNPDTKHWTRQVKAEIRWCPSLSSLTDPFCEPQDRSLRCASAAAGPEPWETRAWASSKNARRDRSVRKHIAVLTASVLERWLCVLLSPTNNTDNVCIPTR